MGGVLEILLEMNKGAGGLDQTLEEIVVFRVFVQPDLLQDIVCFVVMLIVPTFKVGAIIRVINDVDLRRINVIAFQFPHESGNPLAFVHEGLNLIAPLMMGKLARFTFPGDHKSSPHDESVRMTNFASRSAR